MRGRIWHLHPTSPYAFITFSLCGVDSIYAKVEVDYSMIAAQESPNQAQPE
jgi:hypothetical protein